MFLKFKPSNTPNEHWYTGLMLGCVAIVLAIVTTGIAQDEYAFIQVATRAEGVVVAQNAGKHHVQIHFTTSDGKPVEYTQNGWISYEVGDHVKVLYTTNDPRLSASTDAIGSLWINTIAASMFTFGALLFSILAIFFPQFVNIPKIF